MNDSLTEWISINKGVYNSSYYTRYFQNGILAIAHNNDSQHS